MRGLLLLPLLLFSGCETIGFYAQGVAGQAEILWKAKPNEQVLKSAEAPKTLKQRIRLAEDLCAFASEELALPGDSAYHRYADLERPHVVFVLYAAREFSLEPKTWHYPIVGELNYRGYFKETDAQDYAEALRRDGYEICLGGTDAYSTLGLFHDPLLNTFTDYPEIDFAELIFHELTHRRVHRKGETIFNESLASAVAQEGVRRYLIANGRRAELADYEERLGRRRDFYEEIDQTIRQLAVLYASGAPEHEMRARKRELLANLKSRARGLQERWGGKQLETWLSQELTNAHLLSVVTYHRDIPYFEQLLEKSQGDFETFFGTIEERQEGSLVERIDPGAGGRRFH